MSKAKGLLTYLLTLQPADATEEQISMAASSMIRSHSVSGDLHGVQPDPIAADILRKEPEQETFVRLNVPLGKNDYLFLFFLLSQIITCLIRKSH